MRAKKFDSHGTRGNKQLEPADPCWKLNDSQRFTEEETEHILRDAGWEFDDIQFLPAKTEEERAEQLSRNPLEPAAAEAARFVESPKPVEVS